MMFSILFAQRQVLIAPLGLGFARRPEPGPHKDDFGPMKDKNDP